MLQLSVGDLTSQKRFECFHSGYIVPLTGYIVPLKGLWVDIIHCFMIYIYIYKFSGAGGYRGVSGPGGIGGDRGPGAGGLKGFIPIRGLGRYGPSLL